jgi:hypothetical protein
MPQVLPSRMTSLAIHEACLQEDGACLDFCNLGMLGLLQPWHAWTFATLACLDFCNRNKYSCDLEEYGGWVQCRQKARQRQRLCYVVCRNGTMDTVQVQDTVLPCLAMSGCLNIVHDHGDTWLSSMGMSNYARHKCIYEKREASPTYSRTWARG